VTGVQTKEGKITGVVIIAGICYLLHLKNRMGTKNINMSNQQKK